MHLLLIEILNKEAIDPKKHKHEHFKNQVKYTFMR